MTELAFNYQHSFINCFNADVVLDNYPRQVQALYSYVEPRVCSKPTLIAVTSAVAEMLEISEQQLQSDTFTLLMSGSLLLPGMKPYAMNYGGHQFGHWAGQLGDGRAINLATVNNQRGEHYTLQLKGAGSTPYSRSADGLAVLRSSVREFLCSEAMFHLGIATTRALSLSLTGDEVIRDMFYDGRAKAEPGAVVCRVSSCFIRFGSFQLLTARKDIEQLKQLADYVIEHEYPHIQRTETNGYLQWFREVCQRSCTLVVEWMRVGFVHGVLNTDNMSIIGETIDYGPYGWIDDFNLHWTPNTTDAKGKRYRFGAQAEIVHWNLFQLANALTPLIDDIKGLQAALDEFVDMYQLQSHQMMLSKLGLNSSDAISMEQDQQLIADLQQLLMRVETDMTIFYRSLATLPEDESLWSAHLADCYYLEDECSTAFIEHRDQWLKRYWLRRKRSELAGDEIITQMQAVNPKYVLRNYLAQQAIAAAEQGDYSVLHSLQKVLQQPYAEQPEYQHLAAKRPEWAKNKAGCSMLSCSS